MTSPDVRPADPAPGTATEPVAQVPPPAPAPAAAPAYGYPPAPAPPDQQGAPFFMPAAPEPAFAGSQPTGTGASSGSSKVLTYALVGAVLIAAVGVSFAVGRASTTSTGAAGAQGGDRVGGGVFDPNANGGASGNGNGSGPLAGRGPDASFDLNGGGGDGDGGFDGDPDRGLGLDRPGRGVGPGGLSGTVTAVDADSVTVQLDNGQTVTFGLDGSTTYHQQAPATASDVTQGAKVQVSLGEGFRPDQITQGSDGSITLGTAGDVTVVP